MRHRNSVSVHNQSNGPSLRPTLPVCKSVRDETPLTDVSMEGKGPYVISTFAGSASKMVTPLTPGPFL